jgi:hypothetical protein
MEQQRTSGWRLGSPDVLVLVSRDSSMATRGIQARHCSAAAFSYVTSLGMEGLLSPLTAAEGRRRPITCSRDATGNANAFFYATQQFWPDCEALRSAKMPIARLDCSSVQVVTALTSHLNFALQRYS